MLGDLFITQKVSPDILKPMSYHELSYWHKWHKIADNAQAEENEAQAKENERLEALNNNLNK